MAKEIPATWANLKRQHIEVVTLEGIASRKPAGRIGGNQGESDSSKSGQE